MLNTCSIICTAHTLSQTGQIGVGGGCKGASEGREMMTTTKMNVTLKREGERGYLRREVCYFLFRL